MKKKTFQTLLITVFFFWAMQRSGFSSLLPYIDFIYLVLIDFFFWVRIVDLASDRKWWPKGKNLEKSLELEGKRYT